MKKQVMHELRNEKANPKYLTVPANATHAFSTCVLCCVTYASGLHEHVVEADWFLLGSSHYVHTLSEHMFPCSR